MLTLSVIQSELHIRRRSFDPAGAVKFVSIPQSWNEQPAELRLADSESFQVIEASSWLGSQTTALSEMAAVPDNDAEGYRRGLIKQMHEFSKTVDKRIRDQWAREKVCHLYESKQKAKSTHIYWTGSSASKNVVK